MKPAEIAAVDQALAATDQTINNHLEALRLMTARGSREQALADLAALYFTDAYTKSALVGLLITALNRLAGQ